MQEFLHFMNQGWVGTIVGTAGLALALLLYWRSRISGIVAIQSHDVPMIGGSDAVFPPEVEVRYRGTPVPRLISSTVWIWNAGKKTIRGEDVVAHDPLQLHFSGEVLNVRIGNVSRKVIRVTADVLRETRKIVCYGFEFLDPDDGIVLEVHHVGSGEAPECTGTIIGLPKAPQYLGPARGASGYSKRASARRKKLMVFIPTFPIAFWLGLFSGAMNFGGPNNEALPTGDPQQLSWLLWSMGLLCVSSSAYLAHLMWKIRRRIPSSLIKYTTERENDRTDIIT